MNNKTSFAEQIFPRKKTRIQKDAQSIRRIIYLRNIENGLSASESFSDSTAIDLCQTT